MRWSTLAAVAAAAVVVRTVADPVFSTTCNGKPYVYDSLAGYGFVASDFRDKFGDTASMGSAIAITDWAQKPDGSFGGTLFALPDRGWNTNGTINYTPRVHKFTLAFSPSSPTNGTAPPLPPNVAFSYLDTVLLTGPDGQPATGLDPDQSGGLEYPGFPTLPAATYPGDGFGGEGPGGKRVSIDTEGLVVDRCGSFWISDEYGPYIYRFNGAGRMVAAIRPPDAILPLRQGVVSFASDNPPRYDPNKHPIPSNPSQGRQNNQGFEGLTASPDGKHLYAMLQSALWQEGGSSSSTRHLARLLKYSVPAPRSRDAPSLEAEYIVPLPTYLNRNGNTRVAAQSALKFVSDTQLLVLPRDGNGKGTDDSLSRYRHVDVVDISGATDIKGVADAFNTSVASSAGVPNPGVVPATLCPFVDFNLNEQLARFGLHNGGDVDASLLNEKWEGLALVPVTGGGADEYFLFAASDNDFITQNGFTNAGRLPYSDATGLNLDSQMLVFKIRLPPGSKPRVG